MKVQGKHESGFKIGETIRSYLAYSDDKAILGENEKDMQSFLDDFVKEAEKVGLEIHKTKTKSMTIKNGNTVGTFTIKNDTLKQVDEFPYLGYTISSENNHEKAVSRRIGLAWVAFEKKEKIFQDKNIPIKLKTKVYKVYMEPVVLYGLECVTWSRKLVNKIKVFQNDVMRTICNFKRDDRVRISHLV